jgi:antitoxin (DNA-binding transcriptional repressor) of toxin-antitoxin stability system
MQVSLIEAAASLSDLVQAAINGEEVILLDGAHLAVVGGANLPDRDMGE